MAKAKTVYSCTECGAISPKWQGQCPGCGQWNTLVEVLQDNTPSRFKGLANASVVQSLAQVEAEEAPRTSTLRYQKYQIVIVVSIRISVSLISEVPSYYF
jgi:DNA repair protein RadA/Sms